MRGTSGVLAMVLSFAVLSACGGVEDVGAVDADLGQQEANIDICGNGYCVRTEVTSCPQDCNYGGYCGDGHCGGPESSSTCPSDCWGGGCFVPEESGPRGPVPSIDICGNGYCVRTEVTSCPQDCN